MTTRDRNIDAGRATARVRHVKKGTHSARDEKARLNLAAFALEQPDSEEWLRDILAALGLNGDATCPPEDVRLTAFEGVKSPGPRSPTATQFPEGEAS